MKTPQIPNTIIANEILNVLDSTVLSSESKNNVLVDYLDQARYEGFNDGQKKLITEIFSFIEDTSTKELLRNVIEKIHVVDKRIMYQNDRKIKLEKK